MRSRLFLFACLAFCAALSGSPASARGPEPALWKIKNGDSTAYLFGSVHALPRDWQWHTKPLDAAIASADVFVFESELSGRSIGNMRVFLRENGTLPRGKQLSRMLSEQGLADFKTLLARTPIDPDSINVMRPWLALLTLSNSQVQTGSKRLLPGEGVDLTLMDYAEKKRKPLHYFESAQTQLSIFVASSPDDDIKAFEANLHDMLKARDVIEPMLDDWTSGNTAGIAKVNKEAAAKDPRARNLMLDVRNHNWIPQIERLLLEKQTTFITVGAAHLAGPGSVTDLLCQRGWKLERVRTGTSSPPAACPPATKVKSPNSPKEIALRL